MPSDVPAADEAALGAIYQELILDHYRRPRNKVASDALGDEAARTTERRNPLCGDEVAVAVAFDADGRVNDARFAGKGCSISQASASMLTQALRGLTRDEARALVARFTALMQGDADAGRDAALGDLRALGGVARFPARIRCATLAWSALAELLEG